VIAKKRFAEKTPAEKEAIRERDRKRTANRISYIRENDPVKYRKYLEDQKKRDNKIRNDPVLNAKRFEKQRFRYADMKENHPKKV